MKLRVLRLVGVSTWNPMSVLETLKARIAADIVPKILIHQTSTMISIGRVRSTNCLAESELGQMSIDSQSMMLLGSFGGKVAVGASMISISSEPAVGSTFSLSLAIFEPLAVS